MQSHTENLRIKFIHDQQRKFIEEIYKISNYTTKQLAALVKIHPRSFRDWKREKFAMPLISAEFFCNKFGLRFPEKKQIMIQRWKKLKTDANRIGGIARFKRYGSPATPEGRSKGGIRAIVNLKKNGIVPKVKFYKSPDYSQELAEYVGIMLGDGGITFGQCTITLNSEADSRYILFVSKLGEKLFGEAPKIIKRKDSKAICLYYNGVSLVKFFVRIGLKTGNKVKQQVGVPDWVRNSREYSTACLRGLMDTDGGVFLHKYKVNGKEYGYRKISFTNRSVPLLKFVSQTLKELEFTPKTIDKVENKRVWLYNETEVKRYLEVIGTHNKRLLKLF